MQSNIISLDVGDKRVGVARANSVAKLPGPLTTINRDENFWKSLDKILENESVNKIIVGLPRNLDGDDTSQTSSTRTFIAELQNRVNLPIITQDEALTSRKAEKELHARGKKFHKADIDALAAAYILEDYLNETN